jgi:hypothetical protein
MPLLCTAALAAIAEGKLLEAHMQPSPDTCQSCVELFDGSIRRQIRGRQCPDNVIKVHN